MRDYNHATWSPHSENLLLRGRFIGHRIGASSAELGTHGISGWRDEPRATQDVDVLIRKSDHSKAVRAVQRAYPDLIQQELPVVTRFLDPLKIRPGLSGRA